MRIATDLVDSHVAASAILRDEAVLPKIVMASAGLVTALLGVASQVPGRDHPRARIDGAPERPSGKR